MAVGYKNVKFVPVHAMKTYGESRFTAPLVIELINR